MSKEQVYNYLSEGYSNKKTRAELGINTGICDRKIRDYIAELRNDGEMIVSHSQAKGYFIATLDDDIHVLRMRNECISRIRHLKAIVDLCDNWMENIHQEEMDLNELNATKTTEEKEM